MVFVKQAADIFVLASWYSEQHNCNKPIVIVIDDTEQCSGPILAEFIAMLRCFPIPCELVFYAYYPLCIVVNCNVNT